MFTWVQAVRRLYYRSIPCWQPWAYRLCQLKDVMEIAHCLSFCGPIPRQDHNSCFAPKTRSVSLSCPAELRYGTTMLSFPSQSSPLQNQQLAIRCRPTVCPESDTIVQSIQNSTQVTLIPSACYPSSVNEFHICEDSGVQYGTHALLNPLPLLYTQQCPGTIGARGRERATSPSSIQQSPDLLYQNGWL